MCVCVFFVSLRLLDDAMSVAAILAKMEPSRCVDGSTLTNGSFP